ncbi:GDP-L-fucose synthase [Candidatus Electrothrix marina]|uniref:GDP-L-fucose synthase n=1 Tax=Candidatus Electrothrix marina TaxID=1859130 RepID=A0A444JD06_9BACT|nr:GDP-L-fucose synthase [Candidatus Electrothrix marina]
MSTAPSSSLSEAVIYVAGHRGLVGSAICRALEQQGCTRILTRTHAELDLTDQAAVRAFFADNQPDYVFLSAAKVGGIHANDSLPADFIRDNLLIQTNIIDAAHQCGSKKLLFLGSSCIYPKFAPQPMQEEHLLTGELEPTNEWYAVAKIAGIKMCQAYHKQHGFNAISLMPTNLYGPGDNFDLQNSHVLPALIRKFHEAKIQGLPEVEIWGTGTPKREFLHVDDLASACLFLMKKYNDPAIVNVGSGEEVSISELAGLVAEAVGFQGNVRYNKDMPDGTPRKFLDVSKLSALGWTSQITLQQGIADTYAWFLANENGLRK